MATNLFNSFSEDRNHIVLRGRLIYGSEICKSNEVGAFYNKILPVGSSSILKYITRPTTCREGAIAFFRHILCSALKKGETIKRDSYDGELLISHLPDWSKGSSYFLYRSDMEYRYDELPFLITELGCHTMARIHGPIAYKFRIGYSNIEIPSTVYGREGTGALGCYIIRFPNCFLSSQGSMSIWLSAVRKSIEVCISSIRKQSRVGISSIGKRSSWFDSIMEYVEKHSGSFDSMKDVIKSINNNVRDPFEGFKSEILSQIYPLEYFTFMTSDPKRRKALFNPRMWNDSSISGYKNASFRVYKSVHGYKEEFVRHLCSLKEHDYKRVLSQLKSFLGERAPRELQNVM